jgi:hypothetical protein
MGEGTPELAAAGFLASPLHPHPLADADTPRCELAKASSPGEGQGEGEIPPFRHTTEAREAILKGKG